MTKKFDVVIVGGGPAGSALGFLLQKAGISNCIIDKQIFPREKLCGGLLTEKTLSLIKEIYGTIQFPFERITSSVNLFVGMHKLSSVITDSTFCLVNRTNFDNYLLEQYKNFGGVTYEGKRIQKFNLQNKKLILDNEIELAYHILVGADGANSQVRQLINSVYRPEALCIESSYPSEIMTNNIDVFFATVRNGYGWCFPKSNYYTIGIGGSVRQNKNLREAFISFSKNIEKPIENNNIKGAMVPFGKYVKKPCSKNIILIGDAAGLVDPITGEGLYFALKSSKYAYDSINKYFIDKTPLDKSFLKAVKDIHFLINNANIFKKVFFNEFMQRKFLKKLEGRTHITKFFCDNILANYKLSYMQFPSVYIKERHKRKKGV